MMGAKTMMGFMLIFFLLTMLSLIMEGAWIGAREETMLKELTGFTVISESWYAVPLLLPGFILNGIPKLIAWDYSFLADTSWGIYVRLLLSCTVTLGFVWAIAQIILPALFNAIARIGGGLLGAFRGF